MIQLTEEQEGGGEKTTGIGCRERACGAKHKKRGEAFVFLSPCFILIRQASVSRIPMAGCGEKQMYRGGRRWGGGRLPYHDTNLGPRNEGSWQGKDCMVMR